MAEGGADFGVDDIVALPQRRKRKGQEDVEQTQKQESACGPPAQLANVTPLEDIEVKYEWGATMKEALEQIVVCMFNYITDLSLVQLDPSCTRTIEVEGHDMESLLYAYMDEFLYQFCAEKFVSKRVTVTKFDKETFKISAVGEGELFDLAKHEQGADIKAITYSAMQILHTEERADLYVIVDI